MKRVYIAAALAMSMLFGSSASAGGKSINVQVDSSFLSIGWSGHYQRGEQYHRQPRHSQRRRVAPRRNVRHAPRRIYRQRPVYRPAPRRIYRAPMRVYRAPKRIYRVPKRIYRVPKRIYRPAPSRYIKRAPRFNTWQQRRRAKH